MDHFSRRETTTAHTRVESHKTPHAAAADFEHSHALPRQAAPVRSEPTEQTRDEQSAASLQRSGAVREQAGS
jgi:hypothetical protein